MRNKTKMVSKKSRAKFNPNANDSKKAKIELRNKRKTTRK